MTTDTPRGLGPLGNRLLAAFVVVALSSVAVLTIAALLGTARGMAAGRIAERTTAAQVVAAAAAKAYATSGGWAGADLSIAEGLAGDAGARLLVLASDGTVVRAPSEAGSGLGMGSGMGSSLGSGRGSGPAAQRIYSEQPVLVGGIEVGTVRLAFPNASSGAAQQIAWAWILIAALAALLTALVVAWYVTRRISRPLARLSETARAFAAGDRSARPLVGDHAAPGELGELVRAFDTTAEHVERSERARRQMAADLAHELRTPLAALQAGLEELRDGLVTADAERIGALHQQSLRVGRVVDDLAELSSAQTAALSMRRSALDLGDLVDDALGAARRAMSGAGLSVVEHLLGGVMVEGDVDRLHQVVGNLLTNTVRHCRAGDTVTVTVERFGHSARLVVSDTGPGIDPIDLPSVFDRRWRGRADTGVPGSGLGLAVVRELVSAHEGTIEVTSDGTTGTQFTVLLPLAVHGARTGAGQGAQYLRSEDPR